MKNVLMFVGEPLISPCFPLVTAGRHMAGTDTPKRHSPSVPVESSRGGKGKEQPLLLSMLL